ncbi:hypothetical protein UCRPC4_g04989 [Phaeomoniella chlamydospora]|uniref:Telomeric single stranded DNA binding POT1/Cdc13 domain-containing protein n=1 Tax=Phaeomoniella chlamydospora TaxID=158046 RepID=A0A0G2E5V1_PHACM|nr:hypothetical protein UCRPC4_g04989 [Phaeomoniella chlamydospora]
MFTQLVFTLTQHSQLQSIKFEQRLLGAGERGSEKDIQRSAFRSGQENDQVFVHTLEGQVKVAFLGPSAKAVASVKVGIGDRIRLCLDGANWTHLQEDVPTPGKSAEWDLSFENRIELEVLRNGKHYAAVNINEQLGDLSPRRPQIPETQHVFTNGVQSLRDQGYSEAYSSPSFHRSIPTSFLDVSLRPLTEEDGFIWGHGRKRTKFGRRSGEWFYMERSPSPVKDKTLEALSAAEAVHNSESPSVEIGEQAGTITQTDELVVEAGNAPEELATTRPDSPPQFVIPPLPMPRTPGISTPPDTNFIESAKSSDAKTPRLAPLPSPGLPLVSPLVKTLESAGSYFPPFPRSRSELDISGEIEKRDDSDAGQDQHQEFGLLEDHLQLGSHDQTSLPSHQRAKNTDEVEQIPDFLSGDIETSPIIRSGSSSVPRAEISQSEAVTIDPDDHMEIIFHPNITAPEIDEESKLVGSPRKRSDAVVPERTIGQDLDMYGVSDDEQALSNSLDQNQANRQSPARVTQENVEATASRAPPDSTDLTSSAEHSIPRPPSETAVYEGQATGRRWSRDFGSKLIVSATECIQEGLPISSPPFPFQQSWDAAAREESRRRSSVARRRSYRGNLDGTDDDSETEVVDIESSDEDSIASRAASEPHSIDPSVSESDNLERPDVKKTDETRESSVPPSESDDVVKISPRESSTSDQIEELNEYVQTSEEVNEISEPEEVPDEEVESDNDRATDDRIASSPMESVFSQEVQDISAGPRVPIQESAENLEAEPGIQGEAALSHAQVASSPIPREVSSQPEITEQSTEHTKTAAERLVERLPELPGGVSQNDQKIEKIVIRELLMKENAPLRQDSLPTEEVAGVDQNEIPLDTAPKMVEPGTTNQLITPGNTQEGHSRENEGVLREGHLLPMLTPEATQSPATLSGLLPPSLSFDGNQDTKQDASEPRRSSRLAQGVRRSYGQSEIVSPWFTPRKPLQTDDEDHQAVEEESNVPEIETKSFESVKSPLFAEETTAPPQDNGGTVARETEMKGEKDHSQRANDYSAWPQGLRTRLSYFPSLSGLPSHFNQTVDVIVVCSSPSTNIKRAPSGPRDYYTTLHITDPTISHNNVHSNGKNKLPINLHATTAQIFRPWKNALPATKKGDVILLRCFKVQSRKHEITLLSTEGSGWVVFPSESPEEQVHGPPVEYGEKERQHAMKLRTWWIEIHHTCVDKLTSDEHIYQQKEETSEPTLVTHSGRSHKRISSAATNNSFDSLPSKTEEPLKHELRDGMTYVDDVVSTTTQNAKPVPESIHELRDGTKYIDQVSASGRRSSIARSQQSNDAASVHELRDGSTWTDP